MRGEDRFLIARNPDTESSLPFLLRLPLDGGIVLKARDTWPRTARVFCAEAEGGWPDDAELVEALDVQACRRRGVAIDLVLQRASMNRSQFVFTRLRGGRPAIFWQTRQAARSARPGVRVPARRASGRPALPVLVDTRERYAYRFAAQQATVERRALRCGDYAVADASGAIVAAVERKRFDDFAASLVDGSLQFVLPELAELPRAAVAVEGRYERLLRLEHVPPGFVLDLAARLQVRFPSVPIVFAGSRKLAEEWIFRFLGAALAELEGSGAPASHADADLAP